MVITLQYLVYTNEEILTCIMKKYFAQRQHSLWHIIYVHNDGVKTVKEIQVLLSVSLFCPVP